MDSITHIVLGAACGEVVLGKKLGNRAMIWGGIGGSIPDFDVLATFIMDPLSSLAFHRGPMHSLLFVCLIPFLLAPLLKYLYNKEWHQKLAWRITGFTIGVILYIAAATILSLLAGLLTSSFPWLTILILLAIGIYFFYIRYKQIFQNETHFEIASIKEWIILFFVSATFHLVLDTLTTFGTRLYWPFSNTRVSISSIAIADPLYTIPFALFILGAAMLPRINSKRRMYTYLGLAISSMYLILTFINKKNIDTIFEKSLQKENITFQSYITVPTILNNLLWYGIAKQDSNYVYGYYSIMDAEPVFKNLASIRGNHHLLNSFQGQETKQVLPWFSNGYYSVIDKGEGCYLYSDLRFGSVNGNMESDKNHIFKFDLKEQNGILEMQEHQASPENRGEDIEWFVKRIFGVVNH